MKTLRYLLLLGCTTLLATACQDNVEPTPNILPSDGLQAIISDDAAATRTIVIDNPGIRMESFWTSDDQLGTFGEQSDNTALMIDASTISQNGKSATFNSADGIPSGELLAYYPYMSGVSRSGDVLQFSFPSTQHFTQVGGVAQPDPKACVMVGKGSKGTGVSFQNVMAVLKIGQAFTEQTVLKRIEFRDLSGKPVCGSYSVDLSQNNPETSFNGDGKVLALDLGNGLEIADGSLCVTFMVVPARQYPKGFELTFINADGKKTVRTIGTKNGKTLLRSVVHPVGDFGDYSNLEGMTYELKPTAQIMTPDKLDMVTVTNKAKGYVYDDDGNMVTVDGYSPLFLPQLEMIVHKDLNPQVGGWLIFNMPSDDLPQGGIYRITKCEPSPDGQHFIVKTMPEPDFAKPFENLTIGKPLYDDAGNLQEDGGIDIDLAPYVKEIVERDEDGNVINRLPQRQVPTYDMNATEAMTRALVGRPTYSFPSLTISMDDQKHCSCEVSAKGTLKMRIAVGIIHGELQYVYTTCNPLFELSTKFSLYAKMEKDKRQHLYTFYCTGIPVGPVVLLPEISLGGFVGVGGEMKFTASTTFKYDLGTYGLSYQKGANGGLSFHRTPPPPPAPDDNFMPELGAGGSASLYAFGGISMKAGISIYAMCSLGANTDFKLTFGLGTESNKNGAWAKILHLTPEIDIAPYTAVIGGKFSKLWKGLSAKMEFDPLWKRFLSPMPESVSAAPVFQWKDLGEMKIAKTPFDNVRVPSGVESIAYDVKLSQKTLKDYNVSLDLVEGSNISYGWDEECHWWVSNAKKYEKDEKMFVTPSEYLSTGLPLSWMAAHADNGVGVSLYEPIKVVQHYVIGQYKAGTDQEQTFEGTVPVQTSAGKYYGIQISLVPADTEYDKDHQIIMPYDQGRYYGTTMFTY